MSNIDTLFRRIGGQQTIFNPNKDRSLPGKKRRRAIRQARRSNAVLGPSTPTHAADHGTEPSPPVGVARYGLMELAEMNHAQLRAIAKGLGLRGYSKLRKLDLEEFIYRSDENSI